MTDTDTPRTAVERASALRYIRRVLGMEPSLRAQLDLREQEVELLRAELAATAAEHDAQVAAEALRRKACCYRQAEEAGYLFLGESDRVPWEAVALSAS